MSKQIKLEFTVGLVSDESTKIENADFIIKIDLISNFYKINSWFCAILLQLVKLRSIFLTFSNGWKSFSQFIFVAEKEKR